jgi:uncharacterized protein DUF4214
MRFVIREVAVGLTFVVLSIAMTWPLARLTSTAIFGPADPLLNAWILNWDFIATFHHPLQLFQAPVFFPAKYALAFTENSYGVALWTFPFFLFGASAITAHSIAMILGFAFCGYGAYTLGRMITGSVAAGFIAGVFFAFVPYRFHHLSHVTYVWAGWLPLLLASLIHYVRHPSGKRAALFGAVFFMNGLTCLHWFTFGSLAIVLTSVLAALLLHRTSDFRFFARLAVAIAVAGTLLLPFLLPYWQAGRLYGLRRSYAETMGYSATWRDWFRAPRENKLYGSLTPAEAYQDEHPLFPGFAILALAGCALISERGATGGRRIRWLLGTLDILIVLSAVIVALSIAHGSVDLETGRLRLLAVDGSSDPTMILAILLLIRLSIRRPRGRSRDDARFLYVACALLWIVLGIVGSLGLHTAFHTFLFDHFRAFQGIRVPARWSMIAYVGLAGLGAIGAQTLLEKRIRWRASLTVGICAVLLVEGRAAPISWYLVSPDPPPVYRWLAQVPIRGAVLELPMRQIFSEYWYLLGATIHHRPLINGTSGFDPPGFSQLVDLTHRDPIGDDLLPILERRGCSLIVVHVDEIYGAAPVREWLRREIGRGRLSFVRRFDHHIWGDYVFAVTRTEPDAARWRAPERVDPSGRTPTQSLNEFLDRGGYTYNASTFGYLGEPVFSQDVRGTLTVSGWAMSPAGIAAVNLLFDDHRVRIPAPILPSPWVSEPMPWYPRTTRPAFYATVLPPPRIDGRTDLQVEIIDGRGRRTLLDDTMFRWSRKRGLKADDWNAISLQAMLVRAGLDEHSAKDVLDRRITAADLSDRIVADMRGRSDAEFLNRVFYILFDRPPDSFASARYLDKLARGQWRYVVVDTLIESPEFARLYLRPGVPMEPLR